MTARPSAHSLAVDTIGGVAMHKLHEAGLVVVHRDELADLYRVSAKRIKAALREMAHGAADLRTMCLELEQGRDEQTETAPIETADPSEIAAAQRAADGPVEPSAGCVDERNRIDRAVAVQPPAKR